MTRPSVTTAGAVRLPVRKVRRTGHHSPWSFTMATVLVDLLTGVAGGLLGGVRRMASDAPCVCRPRASVPADAPPSPGPDTTAPDATPPVSDATVSVSHVAPAPVPEAEATPTIGTTGIAEDSVLHHVVLEGEGKLPPGPWRWHWVWPTPGRPAGMALVAADGTLVLWSAGGFAPPGSPPDGRPTAEVASALADLPELAHAAAAADTLRWELERTRAVADETRRLLSRVAGTVDDEIGRVHRPSEPADVRTDDA